MIKFPSIEQYRHVIHKVKSHYRYAGTDATGEPIFDNSRALPVLTFRGTVKLHGTNAAISYDGATDEISYQSRSRVLSSGDDNAGFYAAMSGRPDVDDFVISIQEILPLPAKNITVFGEWCGQGIQKGVAVSELPRMFVYFAVRITYFDDSAEWLDINDFMFERKDIKNIMSFETSYIDIDFNYPERHQNELIRLTEMIEARCPVGAHFGIEGVGEGIVWTCITPGWESSKFWMKVKGEKHSSSKVKTLAAIDPEVLKSNEEFLDYAVTESRLEQGLCFLAESGLTLAMSSTGDFIRWVYQDIVKEESDTIGNIANPGKLVAQKAKQWFIKRITNV
jgi:hypothetical protein